MTDIDIDELRDRMATTPEAFGVRIAHDDLTALLDELAALRSAQQWRGIESGVTQHDWDAAKEAWMQGCILDIYCRPYIDEELDPFKTPEGKISTIISEIRQAAYAAGVAAERGKGAAMLEALRAAELALPVLRDMLARLKLSGGIKAAEDTLAQIRAAIAAATEERKS